MNASEIRLHAIPGEVRDDRCHWCDATLSDAVRQRRVEPRYAIDGGRRVLVEIETLGVPRLRRTGRAALPGLAGRPAAAAGRDDPAGRRPVRGL